MTEPSSDSSIDVPKESPRTILFQFVIFPLGVVAIAGVGAASGIALIRHSPATISK